MKYEDHIDHFSVEAHGFADAVARSDLNTTVVSCPDWTVRDLARHLGQLHRWAMTIVQQKIMAERWPFQVSFDEPDDTDRWADWIRDGIEPAVTAFRQAEPSERVWSWGADPHIRFWPRRMLFESVIHRLDVALTLQEVLEVSRDIAAEGIDEWFENLRGVGRWKPPVAKLAGEARELSFAADDTPDTWRVGITPTGWWWDRSPTRGNVHVRGAVRDLLLLLQGRPAAEIGTDGDEQVLQHWLEATKF